MLADCQDITDDIASLTLVPRKPAHRLPQHRAGQYIKLYYPPQGIWLECSITHPPEPSGTLTLHLRHHAKVPIVDALIAHVRSYRTVMLQGPLGHTVLPSPIDGPLLFIAGGTGMAHIYALLQALPHTPFPIQVYWGISKPEDHYLEQEVLDCLRQHPAAEYTPVLCTPDPQWQGREGLVHLAVEQDVTISPTLRAFVSGPYPMVMETFEVLKKKGLPESHFLSDMKPAPTGQP